MDKGRHFAILGAIFGLLGLVLLGIGAAFAVSTAAFQASAERTDGTVVALNERTRITGSGGRTWYPTVEYTVDGRVYSFDSSTGSNPPAYATGDTVPVAYDPKNPSDAQIATFSSAYLMPMVFGGVGAVFTPVGAGLFLAGRRRLRQRKWLRANGRETWATIAEIGIETSVKINGRHPYVVRATWYDERTGRTHAATSDNLRHDPGPGLRGRTHVRVLYDPADPDRNLVDLGAVR